MPRNVGDLWETDGKFGWNPGKSVEKWNGQREIYGRSLANGTSVVAQGTSWPMAAGLYLFKSYLKPCLIVDHISSNHRGGYIYNHIYIIYSNTYSYIQVHGFRSWVLVLGPTLW